MDLQHEFSYTAHLAGAIPVGAGPFGARRIREVTGGEVTGGACTPVRSSSTACSASTES